MTRPFIITADQRMAERKGIKGVVFGPSGIGKTSLLWTLDAAKTLFIDLEAGDLAIEGWSGDTIRPRTWEEFRDFSVFLGGPNPALRQDQPYSQAHYNHVVGKFKDEFGIGPEALEKYDTYFFDSITVAGRLCFQWCRGQPEAFSDKTGKADTRGAYGLHGREMIGALTHLQHTRGKSVWFVGILDQKVDDYGRKIWAPQIEGSKTGLELPGIVDQVVSMVELRTDDGQPYRALVCSTINPWGYPAKDRSGRLDTVEEPHLGRLMSKISGPLKTSASERMTFQAPAPAADAPAHTSDQK